MSIAAGRRTAAGEGAEPAAWAAQAARARGLGRPDLAVRALTHASELAPHDAALWFQLGLVAVEAGDARLAEKSYRLAADLLPERPDIRINIGALLESQNRFDAAAAEYAIAAGGGDNRSAALNNLAGVYAKQGRADDALAIYRRAIRGTAPAAGIWSNYLYTQHYCDGLEASRIAADHMVWGAKMGATVEPIADPAARDRQKARLRIAYLSPNFVRHSVAYFALPLLQGHDRTRVEVWCYSTAPQLDAMTDRLKDAADVWVDVTKLDDAALASRIQGDGIDVLIDLTGHTAGGRPGVLARRPAPLQATYLGYPNTTGLSAVDLRFVDHATDPLGQDDRMASERLVRLPRPFLAYSPDERAPAIATRSGRTMTFGSFNNLAKIGPQCLDLWSEVMRRTPNAKLLMKAKAFADPGSRDRVADQFAARGVKASRLDLRPHAADPQEHLATYGEVDIALDSFPYNGATTTMEALWMGVPVVSLAGNRHAGRVGRSLMTGIGLGRFVSQTPRSFVKAARALAMDAESRASLRTMLRGRVAASPLADGVGLARAIEAALFEAWSHTNLH